MKIIVLDAGHGGRDPGAQGHDLNEKDLVLNLAHRTAKVLKKKFSDVDVRLTRTNDEFIELSDRSNRANSWNADAFISLHINAAASNANGFESFVYTSVGEKTGRLQTDLHTALAPLWKNKARKDRGQKQANFHVLRETKMPAVLLEFGFISNAIDANLLRQTRFLQENAEALADALASHFNLPLRNNKSVYRIKQDGEQIGAYAEVESTLKVVSNLMGQNTKKIELELV
ncbi:MAG: N-acetylmuramoyl-L-alanine amidase [Methyloprofundus sp.]|nr:N-acetylmuramoyl-L-alanine amidase [Methyloprofundus sp.]